MLLRSRHTYSLKGAGEDSMSMSHTFGRTPGHMEKTLNTGNSRNIKAQDDPGGVKLYRVTANMAKSNIVAAK